MKVLLDPFRLTGRLVLAMFVIGGYLFVAICESIWYTFHGRFDKIGDAIGATGRGIVDGRTGRPRSNWERLENWETTRRHAGASKSLGKTG